MHCDAFLGEASRALYLVNMKLAESPVDTTSNRNYIHMWCTGVCVSLISNTNTMHQDKALLVDEIFLWKSPVHKHYTFDLTRWTWITKSVGFAYTTTISIHPQLTACLYLPTTIICQQLSAVTWHSLPAVTNSPPVPTLSSQPATHSQQQQSPSNFNASTMQFIWQIKTTFCPLKLCIVLLEWINHE